MSFVFKVFGWFVSVVFGNITSFIRFSAISGNTTRCGPLINVYIFGEI